MSGTQTHLSNDLRLVITGASRGIGKAIAQALAPHARWMCLVGRDRQALERLAGSLGSVQVSLVVGDILQAQVQEEIARHARAQGGLDVLVNNAGQSTFCAFEQHDPQAMEQLLRVNLMAPMALTYRLMPLLQASPTPQVINVGSTFAYIGYPGYAAYCASKFGLRGFTEALRRELTDSRVRVRLFSPRATATDINSDAVREMNRDLGVNEDTPQEVARAFVAFVFSKQTEERMGRPEAFFSRINQLFPRLVDASLRKQLPRIRRAWSATLNPLKENP